MNARKVKDVFSKDFTSVHETDTLSSCFSLFKEGRPPVLVVLDEQGNYQGIVARRWILRSQFDPNITKIETLMRAAPIISPHDSLSQVARLMLETEIRQLPVYSGEKLLGVVTDEDIIQGMVLEEWSTTKVEAIMTQNPLIVEEEESVGEVLSLFRDQDISHAPVVQNGTLVGIVSVHDIIEHIYHPKERQTLGERVGEKFEVVGMPVKGIMASPVITVLPDTTLKETAQICMISIFPQ